MRFPRLPDWVVYAAIVVALLFAALGRDERKMRRRPRPTVLTRSAKLWGQPRPSILRWSWIFR